MEILGVLAIAALVVGVVVWLFVRRLPESMPVERRQANVTPEEPSMAELVRRVMRDSVKTEEPDASPASRASDVERRAYVPRPPGGPRVDPEFPVDVVGESRYQHILEKICGGRTPDGIDMVISARCIPGDRDREVRVEIQGAPVGFLDSNAAWGYMVTVAGPSDCRARIRGGWDRGLNDMGHFGVRLDLVILDVPPEIAGHRGAGMFVNVVGDSKHQPELREIMAIRATERPAAQVPLVVAELVRDETETSTVFVEIAGKRVGYLGRVDARNYCAMQGAPTQVPATIDTNYDIDGKRARYSVRLGIYIDDWRPPGVRQ